MALLSTYLWLPLINFPLFVAMSSMVKKGRPFSSIPVGIEGAMSILPQLADNADVTGAVVN